MKLEDARIAVVGLGYVGLPLAVEFGKQRPVIGYDINQRRVDELLAGTDKTLEVDDVELATADLTLTANEAVLDEANVYIVTAPTPIDKHKQPDLGPVLAASRTIGRHLSSGDVVIYESTVYPGATEEECVPVLGEASELLFNTDFFVGYSPERINPGDKEHRVHNIVKITSGSTPQTADFVDELYRSIVTVGTHRAPSIKVAEAAKVIENTQRDVNVALVNELAILFDRLAIDTNDVLDAAGTKWNFLNFRPGLVGGHCIGVDPYYLTFKAESAGYHPEIILAGRRLNDSMGSRVASRIVKEMARRGVLSRDARVLVLGFTFKENTPDLRNTRVLDLINELEEYGLKTDVHDPWADPEEARKLLGVDLVEAPRKGSYSAIVVAVAHREFARLSSGFVRGLLAATGGVVYDLKRCLPRDVSDLRL